MHFFFIFLILIFSGAILFIVLQVRHRKVCHLLDVTQLTNGRARLTSAVWLQSVLLNHHATYVRACSVASVMSDSATQWTVTHQLPLSMGSPGKNTGVGCHALLQGIFLTQGSNLWLLQLLHCRQILYGSATRDALLTVYIVK